MTFDEIVSRVMGRLNLTSTDARIRVGDAVNDRYKELSSELGLQTSRRGEVSVTLDPSAPGSTLPEVTITDIEKIININITSDSGGVRTLDEVSYDEIKSLPVQASRLPMQFAVKLMGAQYVTIRLDSFPTTVFTLEVEAYDRAETLVDLIEPNFPESFHDSLVQGALSDEYMKLEKPGLASIAEDKWNSRLSGLRMFIAKSGSSDVFQGKTRNRQLNNRGFRVL